METLNDLLWTYQSLLYQIGINCLLSLAMYVVLATGQLFLAQIGFMAIGAYASAILTTQFGASFALALACGVGLATLTGLVVAYPTLRLTGVYLGIATIAFAEVVRAVIINIEFLGGALGITAIPRKVSLPALYLVVAVLFFLLVYGMRSKAGRAMEATRTDELATRAMGVDVFRVKLTCVLISSALSGLAGVFSAHGLTTISPGEFSFEHGVSILSYTVLGGLASPLGGLIGATVLTILPEFLRGFNEFRVMVNGLVIVFTIMLLPAGIYRVRMMRVRGHAAR